MATYDPRALRRSARTDRCASGGRSGNRRGKILRVNESLGGISRLTFQMSVADLPHAKLMRAIELIGTRVAPLVRRTLGSATPALPQRNPNVLRNRDG